MSSNTPSAWQAKVQGSKMITVAWYAKLRYSFTAFGGSWCCSSVQKCRMHVANWAISRTHKLIYADSHVQNASHARVLQCSSILTLRMHPITPVWAQRIPTSLWDLYGSFNTRRYTLVHGFCLFKLFPIIFISQGKNIEYPRVFYLWKWIVFLQNC